MSSESSSPSSSSGDLIDKIKLKKRKTRSNKVRYTQSSEDSLNVREVTVKKKGVSTISIKNTLTSDDMSDYFNDSPVEIEQKSELMNDKTSLTSTSIVTQNLKKKINGKKVSKKSTVKVYLNKRKPGRPLGWKKYPPKTIDPVAELHSLIYDAALLTDYRISILPSSFSSTNFLNFEESMNNGRDLSDMSSYEVLGSRTGPDGIKRYQVLWKIGTKDTTIPLIDIIDSDTD